MSTSLAGIDNEEFLRRSSPGKHNLGLTDPIEEVSALFRIRVVELRILIMFFGEIITMNNNGSGMLPSLFM
jgi:hypothetical protein